MLFSLETASDYLKDEKASFFGFRCTVIGYEWNAKADDVSICLIIVIDQNLSCI